MGQYLSLMLASARVPRTYAQKLVAGIKPEQAARKPRFETAAGATTIDTNHPVFVFGHLALYPARIMKMLGLDSAPVAAPAGWEDLFKAGAQCRDDADGSIYPTFDAVTKQLFSATDTMFASLATADDAPLLAPTPDERYRERFPQVGGAVCFMLNNHPMLHLGQISAWRRCFGLPPAM